MKHSYLALPLGLLVLFGAGCSTTTSVAVTPSAPVVPPPSPVVVPPAVKPPVAEDTSKTILVSSVDSTKYCDGATMDSDGFRKTITVEKPMYVPPSSTLAQRVKLVAVAATTGMCQTVLKNADITVSNDGTVTIPPVDGWAGVSITMCSCKPLVEVNALRVAGVTKVEWK